MSLDPAGPPFGPSVHHFSPRKVGPSPTGGGDRVAPCLGFATPPPSTRVASARPTITLRRLVALSFVWSFMDLLIVVLLLSISLAEPVKSWMAPPLMCVFFSGSDSFYSGIHGSDGLSDGV